MGVAVKRLRIGRRRAKVETSSPLERARAPALENGSWRVPDRFNLTRDVVEALGHDPKRPALTVLGLDGVIEPRTFRELADGAARWAHILRSRSVQPGDRVIVLSRLNEDWVDIALGCLKVGAIFAPAPPSIAATALEVRVAITDAALVVAGEESDAAIAQMSFTPEVHHVKSGRLRRSTDVPPDEPTADTHARDTALLVWTSGTEGDPKPVAHTHGSLFAARVAAEHWLDAGPGDVVWCTAGPGSWLALPVLAGAWTRGAVVVLHEGDFDPVERLDLIRRIGPSVLCQSPREYRALAELRQLERYRPPRLRRLLATGDTLEHDLVETYRERWGLEISSGYGQAETGIVATTRQREERAPEPGEIGEALPGHHLAVVDEHGTELPPGVEGMLAVRGRPPTLFAGYWDAPEETKRSFHGDWYLTGDAAAALEPGAFHFLARANELITTRGRTFGPREVERALDEHTAVVESAVVGMRDLERGGQFVRAFVVLERGVESSEQLEAELRQFAAERLPEQQVPREIEFVDALPRSPSGAVRRLELRDRPLSGRPLWELPPTSEIEPKPPATVAAAAQPETAAPAPRPVGPSEARLTEPAATTPPLRPLEREGEPSVQPAGPTPPLELGAPSGTAEPPPAPATTATAHPPVPLLAEPGAGSGELSSPTDAASVEAPAGGETHTLPPLEQDDASADRSGSARLPEPEASLGEPETTPEQGAALAVERPSEAPAQASTRPGEAPLAPTESPQASDVVDERPDLSEGPPSPSGALAALPPEPVPSPAGGAETVAPPLQTPAEHPLRAEEPPPPSALRVAEPEPHRLPQPEPLPDYIRSPAEAYASVPPRAPEPEPEPPTDLGPLPEYVVDPERRLEAVAEPSSPVPPVEPSPSPPAEQDPSLREHPLAGLARPPVAIPIPTEDETPTPRGGVLRGRRRSKRAYEPGHLRGRSQGEPGDEGLETGWMHRFSSRLSAYGMSEDAGERRREASEREGRDEHGPT